MGHGGFNNEGKRDSHTNKKNPQRSHSNNVPNTFEKEAQKNNSHGRLPSQGNHNQIYNK